MVGSLRKGQDYACRAAALAKPVRSKTDALTGSDGNRALQIGKTEIGLSVAAICLLKQRIQRGLRIDGVERAVGKRPLIRSPVETDQRQLTDKDI